MVHILYVNRLCWRFIGFKLTMGALEQQWDKRALGFGQLTLQSHYAEHGNHTSYRHTVSKLFFRLPQNLVVHGNWLCLSILEDAGYLTPPMRRQIWVVYKRMNQLPLSPSAHNIVTRGTTRRTIWWQWANGRWDGGCCNGVWLWASFKSSTINRFVQDIRVDSQGASRDNPR